MYFDYPASRSRRTMNEGSPLVAAEKRGIVGKQSEYHERNARLSAPIQDLRREISERWQGILPLLDGLGIPHKKKIHTKITDIQAYSWEVRDAVKNILQHPFDDRAKAGKLFAELAEIDELAVLLSDLRNKFLEPQIEMLVGGFLKKYSQYYGSVLDYEERKEAGGIAVMRAAEKFNPERGGFSTYAYCCIRSEIQNMAAKERRHLAISLDAPLKGEKSDDGATLLNVIASTRGAVPTHSASLSAMLEELDATINDLEPVHQALIRMRFGLNDDGRVWAQEKVADELNRLGFRTPHKQGAINRQKVCQWETCTLRKLTIHMKTWKKELED